MHPRFIGDRKRSVSQFSAAARDQAMCVLDGLGWIGAADGEVIREAVQADLGLFAIGAEMLEAESACADFSETLTADDVDDDDAVREAVAVANELFVGLAFGPVFSAAPAELATGSVAYLGCLGGAFTEACGSRAMEIIDLYVASNATSNNLLDGSGEI